jgi:SOS response regulatory protein OraA/RecX
LPESGNQYQKAKNYSLLLLKYRGRSEAELRQRLSQKDFAPQAREEAIAFLKGSGLVSAGEDLPALCRRRLKAMAALEPQKAKARLYSYLLRRGFSPEAIEEAIGPALPKGRGREQEGRAG